MEVDEIKNKIKYKRKNKKSKTRISKDITIYNSKNSKSNNKSFNIQKKFNSPPKKQSILNLYEYIKKREEPNEEEEKKQTTTKFHKDTVEQLKKRIDIQNNNLNEDNLKDNISYKSIYKKSENKNLSSQLDN